MSRARLGFVLLLVVVVNASSCVLVSSTSVTPPRSDSGTDAHRPSLPDAQPIDAAERPQLTRDEATRGLLASVGSHVVLPAYEALATEAASLEAATQAYASARTPENLAAAQEAWRRTMTHFEEAELYQFGPASMLIPENLGGRGLRDAMYAIPTHPCSVSITLIDRLYDDLDVLAAQPAFARGLGAIELALFETDEGHGCDPGATLRVDDAEWAALGVDGVLTRRAEGAYANARLIRGTADALVAAWSPDGDDFAGELANPGGSGVYPTSQSALNAMFWAMYYVDRTMKDMKVGLPTGINELCAEDSCPERLESRWAARSVAHLAANLLGLQRLFLGGPVESTDAIGFDDLLYAIGQAAVSEDIERTIASARSEVEALPPIDLANFAENEVAFEHVHESLRMLSVLLKVDFAGVLAFTPPPGAGEDND